MTLVKPKSDDQVQGEQTKKRTHRLPRPKHGKRWSLLIVALLLILAFAGKFLLSKGLQRRQSPTQRKGSPHGPLPTLLPAAVPSSPPIPIL
mgnify:CR=1 FL=1